MAPARRQTNGRSPLVNKQSQITTFFSTFASSSSSPSPIPPKQTLKNPNPSSDNCPTSNSPSSSPTTPSPLQPKRKKPILTISSSIAASAAPKSFGSDVIGKRVRVYWPLDDAWYEGCVKSYDTRSNKHAILYDDAEEEAVELSEEKIEWVEEESTKKFKRLRRGSRVCVVEEVTGYGDDVEGEGGVDDVDEDDEDWGKGVGEIEDEDDEVELVDEEDAGAVETRASGKPKNRKIKVGDEKEVGSGKKRKSGVCSGDAGKEEVNVLTVDGRCKSDGQ